MECELNGVKLKYENETLYSWQTMWRKHPLKTPKWVIVKGTVKSDGRRNTCIGGRTTNGGKMFKYHRIIYYIHNPNWDIYDIGDTNKVDHIDRNPSNNNINNLRILTHQQNMWNNGAKGYTWHNASQKWRVRVMVNRKEIYGGLFVCEEEAAKAGLALKAKHHIY